ncbi:CpsD/CapB family tyrosine-protein kinase [Alkaliphilus pronyensis]|uniref:CpsD/CapB family tyrosine-protein kinase n=1 Tax=Alkaliphilus pronyensis TaxID=1482732 RepID=A0A6I0F8I3_9FIRM|nr:hypothetical protein [Alkaliphilus pronyensis]KAB3536279.1 CpsD/CapB family tyrosine-protein kinase [Alkaliphilus pronyensis]
MLLYLTSNDQINLLDFLNDEHGIIIKKLSGTFSLRQFVLGDLRSLNHFQYIVIDLNAIKDSNSDIMEAVNAYKKMFTSRMIFYIEDMKSHHDLALKLVENGIFNIVIAEDIESIRSEFLKSISDLGISKRDIMRKLAPDEYALNTSVNLYKFSKKDVKIAVTGVQNRVGTTTMAINLANYLSSIGAKVCYVEANEHDHLSKLPAFYQGMTSKDDVILYNGVKYLSLHSECHDEFDFIIYDMGVINNKIISAIRNNCDAAVLCATGKPYEINDIEKYKDLLDTTLLSTIFSLVAEPDQHKFLKLHKDIYFSNYTPNYFDGDANESIWTTVIKPFIRKSEVKYE